MSTTNRTQAPSLSTPFAHNDEAARARRAREAAIRATFHIDYDSDSDLSDPPNEPNSPTHSDACVQPNSSSSSDSSNSFSLSSAPPLSLICAHHISSALSLTVAQSHALHASMQSAMLDFSLLGNMSFRASVHRATKKVLTPVFARVKAELEFLKEKEKSVGRRRLGELLMARARILNQNEKHNKWMVKNGRVRRRRERVERAEPEEEVGAGADAEQDEGVQSEAHDFDNADGEGQPCATTAVSRLGFQDTEDEHDDVQDKDQDEAPVSVQDAVQGNAETVTRTSIPITLLLSGAGRDDVDNSARSNTSILIQADTPIEVQPNTSHSIQANTPVDAQPNTSHHLQPSLPADARPNPALIGTINQFNQSINQPNPDHNQPVRPASHPTAFLIRHTTTTYAAAILSAPNLTLTRFTALVSAQLGFNATGRIKAVVPRWPQATPVNVFVRLDSEETWRAMVEIWAVWGRRVGKAIVE